MARLKDVHRPPARRPISNFRGSRNNNETILAMIGVVVLTIVTHGLLSKLHQIGEEA